MKDYHTPAAFYYFLMRSSFLMFFTILVQLIPVFASGQEDSIRSSKFAISTNTLSFFGGHVGPEFRATISSKTDYRKKYVIGYRLAYGIHGFENTFPKDDLTSYRQSLKMGHDLTIGMKYNFSSSRLSLMPFLAFGRFDYANSQTLCLQAAENSSSIFGYCVCEEVGNNDFTEVAYRVGFGVELQYTLFIMGRWSIGASGSILLTSVFRERLGFNNHDTCSDLDGILNVGQQPQWGEETSFWLQSIPYTRNQTREESSLRIVGRIGLWVNYQF